VYDDYRPLVASSGGGGGFGGGIGGSVGGGTPVPTPADGGTDSLVFGAGIGLADIRLAKSGNNLIVTVRDPANPAAGDSITLQDWAIAFNQIETFVFADGSTFSIAGILAHPGTDGPDVLSWTDGPAWLDGGSGNDVLTTGAFNDTLRGGPGNDRMIGGAGTDTAVYDGPASAYTVVSWNGNVAMLNHGADGSDRLQGIETVRFSDTTLAASSATAFDPWNYIASYGDLIAAFGLNAEAGFDHYIDSGFAENRATHSFDAVAYLASNPDLMSAGPYGTNRRALPRSRGKSRYSSRSCCQHSLQSNYVLAIRA
jgi:Ca2+-binding RTX toxin-like protein